MGYRLQGKMLEAGPVRTEIEAIVGATGQRTVLSDTAFSSIPGSPAYVAGPPRTRPTSRRSASASTSRTATPSRATSCSSTPPDDGGRAPGPSHDARCSGRRRDRLPPLAAVVGGLVALAWLSIATWSFSPYDRYLHHGSLDDLTMGVPAAAAIFVGGWALIVVAMMLPTTYPVLALFRA